MCGRWLAHGIVLCGIEKSRKKGGGVVQREIVLVGVDLSLSLVVQLYLERMQMQRGW